MPIGKYIRTEKIKQALSTARKKNWEDPNCKYHTEKFKKSRINIGEKNGNYNKPVSEERRKKQSISMKKKRADPNSIYNSIEWRKKISDMHTDPNSIYQSKEYREKISKANKGKIRSLEAKERYRMARLSQILPTKDSIPEKIIQKKLKENNIKFNKHIPLIGQPDVFIKPNICIFVDGDYWHANPKKYMFNSILYGGKTAHEIWKKDERVTKKLEASNYKVLRFWETDILNNIDCILNEILLSLTVNISLPSTKITDNTHEE